jgi:hypothetical protein
LFIRLAAPVVATCCACALAGGTYANYDAMLLTVEMFG